MNWLAEGFFDRSATIEVIPHRKPVTFTQRIKTGKTMLVTGNPSTTKRESGQGIDQWTG
jgi:hypothetical protein